MEAYDASTTRCNRLNQTSRHGAGKIAEQALPGNQCDRGKGVPSFDEMVYFALVEVDFVDPTTNVRGRRALAIAKPTPRGY